MFSPPHSTTSILYTEIIAVQNNANRVIPCPGSMVVILRMNTRIRIIFLHTQTTDSDGTYF